MYGVIFNFEPEALRAAYHSAAFTNAHGDVRRVLTEDYRFTCVQGDVYFGDESVTSVTCILAVQSLDKQFSWFSKSSKEVKMFRTNDLYDLGPAIGRGSVTRKKNRSHLKIA